MHAHADENPQQTPAQWAVRWHAAALALLLTVVVPAWHLYWHVLCGNETPVVATKSTQRAPDFRMAGLLDGSWATQVERYLREASPLTFALRGSWNELLYRFGVPQSTLVHFGTDGWFYGARTLDPDVAELQRRTPVRRRFLAAVKAQVERAGATLVVMVVPDKVRIHPEHAQAGALSAAKESVYGLLLDDLRAVDIVTVDLAAVLRAAKSLHPTPLYRATDTHWLPAGAFSAALAVAAAIENGSPGRVLAPRQEMRIAQTVRVREVGDLVAGAGFCSYQSAHGRAEPSSMLTAALVDDVDYHTAGVVTPQGTRDLTDVAPAAELVLAGTSFSKGAGAHALRLALGREIEVFCDQGASGVPPLRNALAALPGRASTKVLIWEIVERGFFEDVWRDPRL